ncbi:MAG TPA: aldo/keto reductase [bacterium]|jgi:aryl-alcohol dehydrogenase-like predicted oxidoreductase|nr:aldo/keto reductase [bacterium]
MSELDQFEMGIGTWAWGDKGVWGYGENYNDSDLLQTFLAAVNAGAYFFDTAEVYGDGLSETYLGRFMKERPQVKFYTASKFMPFPWKIKTSELFKSLKASLKRLDIPQLDLYQIHFPMPFRSIETWMEPLAAAVKEGLVKEVGVSNYSRSQMLRAQDALGKHGVPLTSNQVQYSLVRRKMEFNGVLDECKKSNIKLIAFSPLGMGMLSGKYTPQNPPKGPRRIFYFNQLGRIQVLVKRLKEIGETHGGKTCNQVALNWLLRKGVLPIPGAKSAEQVKENLGAIGWRLTGAEMTELDELSSKFTW